MPANKPNDFIAICVTMNVYVSIHFAFWLLRNCVAFVGMVGEVMVSGRFWIEWIVVYGVLLDSVALIILCQKHLFVAVVVYSIGGYQYNNDGRWIQLRKTKQRKIKSKISIHIRPHTKNKPICKHQLCLSVSMCVCLSVYV